MFKTTHLKEHHLDAVVAILNPIVHLANLKKSLRTHIKKGGARIGIDNETGEIEAIACFLLSRQKRCSLSHYWVHPKHRGKPISLFFYTHIFAHIPQGYEIYIYSRDVSGYERYFEKTFHEDTYKFIGVRDKDVLKEKVSVWAKL